MEVRISSTQELVRNFVRQVLGDAPGPGTWSKEVLEAYLGRCVDGIAGNVPARTWMNWKEWFDDKNLEWRDDLEIINRANGLSESTSLLKLMSYHGAVRLPQGAPSWMESWKGSSGQRYMDLGNDTYKDLFSRIACEAKRRLGLCGPDRWGPVGMQGWRAGEACVRLSAFRFC